MIPVDFFKLFVSIVVCELAGGIGSIFNIKAIPKWYRKIKRPSFNPPNWIFGPVWTTLYLLIGISFYFVWNSNVSGKEIAIILFVVQLVLNILWSGIFFGLRKPGYAFIEIILLWASILAMIIFFYPISNVASYLLIPYFLWVSFASVLNFSIWFLNK